ncbi:MAG: hypothetical protein P8X42_15175 [Calditrichaceae bacterium]
MAQNKSSLFDQDDIQLAAIAKALAHPARIRILKILLDSNVCMCGEIEGPKICYCLNPEVIEKVKDQFTQLFIKIQKGKNFDES